MIRWGPDECVQRLNSVILRTAQYVLKIHHTTFRGQDWSPSSGYPVPDMYCGKF
jgi:hypothetical protein